MIGASNYFEVAVAGAIALFGLQSRASLGTAVGLFIEVLIKPELFIKFASSNKHTNYNTLKFNDLSSGYPSNLSDFAKYHKVNYML
jgi:hypothetical protein